MLKIGSFSDSKGHNRLNLQVAKFHTRINSVTVLLDHGILMEEETFHPYDIQCFNDFNESFKHIANEFNFNIQYLDDHSTLLKSLQNKKPEFLINLVNYGFMRLEKNNYFSSIFEMLNIPFMNANMTGITLTDDKWIIHLLANSINVPSPVQETLRDQDILLQKPLSQNFPFPAFLKLRNGRGSCGITQHNLIRNLDELYQKFPIIRQEYVDHSVLSLKNWVLQEYLPGPEFNVAMLGNNQKLTVFPIMELYFDNSKDEPVFQTYQFKAKILDSKKDPTIARKLPPMLAQEIKNNAKKLFRILECRDYCRMEFRCDRDGVPKIIDVNPLTSYGKEECFSLSARMAGYNYTNLWKKLLHTALDRYNLTVGHPKMENLNV